MARRGWIPGPPKRDWDLFEEITIATGKGKVIARGLPSVLHGNYVIRLVRHERVIFVEKAVFTTASGPLPVGMPQAWRNGVAAHAPSTRFSRARALMSEKKRFHAAISASSDFSWLVSTPSRFLSSKSPVRLTESPEGRKATISLGSGPRAKNSITSCAKALLAAQGRPKPRSMIAAKSSRPESICRTSFSGRSMVTCTGEILAQSVRLVNRCIDD